MQLPKTLLRLFPLLAIFALPTVAQHGGLSAARDYEVNVQVRNPDGSAGPRDIRIVLESAVGGVDAECNTVDGGKCRLLPQSSGVYIVKLRASGYQEASQRVELTGVPHAYVTFTLRRTDGDTGVAPSADAPATTVGVDEVNIPEKARQEFEKGQASLKEKKLDDGVRHFQKAVKLYDNYPQAYRMLGEAYLEQQDWQKAEAALKKSIELQPRLAASYVDLGAIANQQHNYAAAEESLKKGLELSPDASAAKYELAKTYWAMGRWQDAEPLARDTVKAQPEIAGAHVLLANILLKKRDGAGALHEYEEYIRLEPNGTMAPQVREMIAKIKASLPK
jgi:tetratricopeptide (TPR) repeat protein